MSEHDQPPSSAELAASQDHERDAPGASYRSLQIADAVRDAQDAQVIARLRDENARLQARLDKWESEIGAVMPADYKDWHENAVEEHPMLARSAIESARNESELWYQSCDQAWKRIAELEAERVRLYTIGYRAGHEATVESQYVHVLPCDEDTYFADDVAALREGREGCRRERA